MQTPQFSAHIFAEHASEILDLAARHIRTGRRFALITSLAIEGGAARDLGSLALVDDAGVMTGYLSNGCIDRDIQLRAVEALRSGKRAVIRYGDGSRYVDLKLPCGGALSVLIDPSADTDAILKAARALAARQPVTLNFDRSSLGDGTLTRSFTYHPVHRLVLAGRGAIFRAMAQMAAATGYDLHLMSPDAEDLAATAYLAGAPPIHLTSPTEQHDFAMLDRYSAFVTLFHDHDWEPGLLRAALDRPVLFIGSLGSRRTHEMRCETLRQMGVAEASLARLHGPIGLVPSLRDGTSIAVSALAEVVQAFQAARPEVDHRG